MREYEKDREREATESHSVCTLYNHRVLTQLLGRPLLAAVSFIIVILVVAAVVVIVRIDSYFVQ